MYFVLSPKGVFILSVCLGVFSPGFLHVQGFARNTATSLSTTIREFAALSEYTSAKRNTLVVPLKDAVCLQLIFMLYLSPDRSNLSLDRQCNFSISELGLKFVRSFELIISQVA